MGVPAEAVAEAYDAFERGEVASPLTAAAISNQTIQESMRLLLMVRAHQVMGHYAGEQRRGPGAEQQQPRERIAQGRGQWKAMWCAGRQQRSEQAWMRGCLCGAAAACGAAGWRAAHCSRWVWTTACACRSASRVAQARLAAVRPSPMPRRSPAGPSGHRPAATGERAGPGLLRLHREGSGPRVRAARCRPASATRPAPPCHCPAAAVAAVAG
jgi:hypothetical protein